MMDHRPDPLGALPVETRAKFTFSKSAKLIGKSHTWEC